MVEIKRSDSPILHGRWQVAARRARHLHERLGVSKRACCTLDAHRNSDLLYCKSEQPSRKECANTNTAKPAHLSGSSDHLQQQHYPSLPGPLCRALQTPPSTHLLQPSASSMKREGDGLRRRRPEVMRPVRSSASFSLRAYRKCRSVSFRQLDEVEWPGLRVGLVQGNQLHA